MNSFVKFSSILILLSGLATTRIEAIAPTFSLEFGKAETVYDYSVSHCDEEDIPDFPARALVDINGNLQLYSTHHKTRKSIGPNLSDLTHKCDVIFTSEYDKNPRSYNTDEYLIAPYTLNGQTIYSLIHTEYHGDHAGFNNCALKNNDRNNCWWTSINLAKSTDAGQTYTHKAPPSHNIGNTSIDYDPNNELRHKGLLQPSNIIKKDEYYYTNLDVLTPLNSASENRRICTMRTNNLDNPSSWRLWDGTGWNVSPRGVPASGNCAKTTDNDFDLHYSTYLGSYVTVGARNPTANKQRDLVVQASSNLVNYDPIMELKTPYIDTPRRYVYFTLLQPGAETRNFEDISRSPWLYYVTCGDEIGAPCTREVMGGLNRDLKRVRVRFNKPEDVGKYDVLDLRFNEYKGAKTLDSSFYGNDGTLVGGVSFKQQGDRKFTSFTQTGKVTIPHTNNLNLTQDISITATIRTTQSPAQLIPIAFKQTGARRNYGLYLSGDGKLHFSLSNGTAVSGSYSSTSINNGTWHNIQITYSSASDQTIYTIDGKLDRQVSQPGNLADGINDSPLILGQNSFIGDLDRFTIYNYLLPSPTAVLPGDFNGDNKVSAADYTIFVAGYPSKYTIFDYAKLVAGYGN